MTVPNLPKESEKKPERTGEEWCWPYLTGSKEEWDRLKAFYRPRLRALGNTVW